MKNYNEVRDRIPRTVRGQDGRILPSLGANEIARFVEFHRSCFAKKVKWIITWQEPMGPCTQLQKIVTYREVFRFAGVVAPGFVNIVNKLGKLSGFFIFCFLKLLPKQLKEDCILRLEQSNRAGNEKAQFFYHLSPAVTKFDRRPGFKVKWRALLTDGGHGSAVRCWRSYQMRFLLWKLGAVLRNILSNEKFWIN